MNFPEGGANMFGKNPCVFLYTNLQLVYPPFDMAHFVVCPRFCRRGVEDVWEFASYFSLGKICNLCTPPYDGGHLVVFPRFCY